MILASAGWMKMMAIEELVRIRLYYRLASALYFIVFTYTTYKAFKDYKMIIGLLNHLVYHLL